ncbi:hypothetical protein J5N97_022561 [Dioscorea zingiberensis]|uniref:ABC transporter domain-containing protein n=1 Tax=Dioscorea zingiberensis TaxID=325984 RepID=A0A9D5CB65_9LILI|nr:hypothetical protein J5N97_022561 [Dioscorea zingiberensis]
MDTPKEVFLRDYKMPDYYFDKMLFSGTVVENIAYRHLTEKINVEQVEKAARVANADEFIRMLPRGYETNIGQRGSLLSGGQKQRLAIARALYHKLSVLILDEATSALDSRSELLVRQALEHLVVNHTVLVIAHRLETILMADRVFVLSGGKLEELAKSSLLTQDGKHAPPELSAEPRMLMTVDENLKPLSVTASWPGC